jgi:hypothetical protein
VTPLLVALWGAGAGVVGAVLLTPLVYLSRAALGVRDARRPRNALAPGVILSEAAAVPPDLLQVTAVFVQKVATGLFGASLTMAEQRLYGTLWHLVYGAFWGVGYALIQTSLAVPPILLGPAYGLFVWAAGPAWLVPRMRLMLPLGRQTRRVTLLVIAWHLLYGLALALAVDVLRG